MLDVDSTNRITICGIPGTGKTTFARHLATQFAGAEHDVRLFDPLDQYGDLDEHKKVARLVPGADERLAFERFSGDAWSAGNTTIFAEEAELYISQTKGIADTAKSVILRGRNRGIGVVAITRRIADLNKTFFSLSEHVFIFRHFSPNDVAYLASFIGKDTAASLDSIPDFHFLHFTHGEIKLMPPIAYTPHSTDNRKT